MKRYFILIIILIGKNCFGQNNRIDSLFNEFKNDIEIEQREYLGRIVWDDETKLTYYSLLDICSDATLLKFTNDSNAVIRTYMFLGLVRNSQNKKLQKKILKKHRNDTTEITEKKGCVILSWKVIEHMKMTYLAMQENELHKINYKEEINNIRNEPKILIDGTRHGIIEKENLQKLDSLTFSKDEFKVTSFSISIDTNTLYSSSNKLTETMKTEIKKLKKEDKIYFDDIKVKMTDNLIRNFGSLTLKIR